MPPRARSLKAASACLHHPLAWTHQAWHQSRTASFPVSTGFPPSWRLPAIPNITDQLLKGVKLGDRTYKNHLDGYNQMDLLTGKGPSARHEVFYFGGPHLGAIRIDDFKFQFFQQPWGWPGEKITTDMPTIVNIRQDPFERTPSIRGESLNNMGGGYMNRLLCPRVLAICHRATNGRQTRADGHRVILRCRLQLRFNLDAIKAKVEEMIKAHEGQ